MFISCELTALEMTKSQVEHKLNSRKPLWMDYLFYKHKLTGQMLRAIDKYFKSRPTLCSLLRKMMFGAVKCRPNVTVKVSFVALSSSLNSHPFVENELWYISLI